MFIGVTYTQQVYIASRSFIIHWFLLLYNLHSSVKINRTSHTYSGTYIRDRWSAAHTPTTFTKCRDIFSCFASLHDRSLKNCVITNTTAISNHYHSLNVKHEFCTEYLKDNKSYLYQKLPAIVQGKHFAGLRTYPRLETRFRLNYTRTWLQVQFGLLTVCKSVIDFVHLRFWVGKMSARVSWKPRAICSLGVTRNTCTYISHSESPSA